MGFISGLLIGVITGLSLMFGFISGLLIGVITGLILMFWWAILMRRRRVAKRVDIECLASLTRDEVETICRGECPDWVFFHEYEKVEWLNKAIAEMWPDIADVAPLLVADSVDQLLTLYCPPGIKSMRLHKLSLGTKAPTIEGVRVQSLIKGQITLDISLRYEGDLTVTFAVDTFIYREPLCIELKHLRVLTIFRVILQLSEEVPWVSAVAVALLRQPRPQIDFKLKVLRGVSGLVTKLVRGTVNATVQDKLEWPHRIVVPIIDFVNTSDLDLKPQGKLVVDVVRAYNLSATTLSRNTHPYVVLHVQHLFKVKTSTRNNSKNPEWNQQFELIAEDTETQSLIVEVYNEELVQDTLLGTTELPLRNLVDGISGDVELELLATLDKDDKDVKKIYRGKVVLKVEYWKFNLEEQMKAIEEANMELMKKRAEAASRLAASQNEPTTSMNVQP